MRGDWKDSAMQYRDIDRAAQKRAEDEIERQRYAEKMRPRKFKFRYWQGVKYVAPGKPAPASFVRCGHCLRAWDDSRPSTWTPAPAGRCPFEYWHRYKAD